MKIQRLMIAKLCFGLVFMTTSLFAQDEPILLKNPSFQDVPHVGGGSFNRGPRGWQDCGDVLESPPDVHPSPNVALGIPGYFGVDLEGQDGNTYLGMVVRDNDTQEAVGQRLSKPLQAGKCYEMSLYLARSKNYISRSRKDSIDANYTQPIKIRVYGGSGYCRKTELLDETDLVDNIDWEKYDLRFEPTTKHKFILIQAFYKTPTLFPYNGNVLVDNLSAITPVPCDDEAVVSIDEPKKADPQPKVKKPENKPKDSGTVVSITPVTKPKVDNPKTDPIVQVPVQKERIIKELEGNRIKIGQSIKLKKLLFGIDQAEINTGAEDELDEVVAFMQSNPAIAIEIQGHTNDRCDDAFCNELSQKRAESVAAYLVGKGIEGNRIKAIGYGKTKPIASNKYSAGRRKNQRVEIKITQG